MTNVELAFWEAFNRTLGAWMDDPSYMAMLVSLLDADAS